MTNFQQTHQPNVYQMWFAIQPKPLWITHTTWANLYARVSSVGTVKGEAPYYGNPEVRADIYFSNSTLKQRNAEISAPGTYKTWRQIAEPIWARN